MLPATRETPLCIIFAETPVEKRYASRTFRALEVTGARVVDCSSGSFAEANAVALGRAVWLVRAGTWPARRFRTLAERSPPRSSTGRPLCALGALIGEPGAEPTRDAVRWSGVLHATGGDLGPLFAARTTPHPLVVSAYLEEELSAAGLPLVSAGLPLVQALRRLARERVRVVRYAALDVHGSSELRVAQVVTSLQRGGAERLVVELANELPRWNVQARVYSIDSPTRAPFAAPRNTFELAELVPAAMDRDSRFDVLARELAAQGTDLVHAHLLDAGDLERLSARGYRSVVTVHNTRQGFPAGLADLDSAHASLLVGCARAVEKDLERCGLGVPLRTVWNGTRDVASAYDTGRAPWRARLGLSASDVLLAAVANVRPQKRLHLLPEILAEVRLALGGAGREVKLVLAGAASPRNAAARAAEALLVGEIERLGLSSHVHLAGLVTEPRELLRECDVLLSPSDHEGLSLAHLEALSLGVPVVATGAGGTAEVAREAAALRHLPRDSPSSEWARAIGEALRGKPTHGASVRAVVARHFSLSRMVEGYARLYPRAWARSQPQRVGEGIVLVTNNFSAGGAQSSARRLLLGLREAGVHVRAVVIEEQPAFPTSGRKALCDVGIPVLALPPPAEVDPARAVARLLDDLEQSPPQAVLLWNVIAEYKILIADGLLDIPLFDVSPGEMYFRSLERYFESTRRPGLPYQAATEYGARLRGVVVKYEAEAALAESVLGAPVHVIPNGVSVGPARHARTASDRTTLAFGTSVRIHPDKKLLDLVTAFRVAAPRLPPYVLRIAGGVDGRSEREASELERACAGLNVQWLGELADTSAFLDALDVFVLVAEPAGCPNASLEAMARGLPVIATDVGGMSEQVVDGVTGRLVPRGDAEAFAHALVELARDADQRARFGSAGRARIESRFSLERMVTSYSNLCLPATRARTKPECTFLREPPRAHGFEPCREDADAE